MTWKGVGVVRIVLPFVASLVYAVSTLAQQGIAVPDAARQRTMIQRIRQSGEAYASHVSTFSCVQELASKGGHNLVVDFDIESNSLPEMRAEGVLPKTLVSSLFSPGAEPRMEWSHWASLRAKKMAVFHYTQQTKGSEYQGLIYIDENRGVISRITFSRLPDFSGSFNCRAEDQ